MDTRVREHCAVGFGHYRIITILFPTFCNGWQGRIVSFYSLGRPHCRFLITGIVYTYKLQFGKEIIIQAWLKNIILK